ncbi:MAG: hypothetical protein FWH33_06835 [Oscillospiraceae bacterium]|nr:hypothetical protein [Oscillospiraceae bacterium]
MPKAANPKIDYDAEIALIDEIILSHRKDINKLSLQRQLLLSKKQHTDMDVVLEHIINKGLTATEVLELINDSLERREK